tara:strand:- start:1528 stop:1722 length:195 start_codon:yes stop_codon:yes gene_type:complete
VGLPDGYKSRRADGYQTDLHTGFWLDSARWAGPPTVRFCDATAFHTACPGLVVGGRKAEVDRGW